MERITRYQVGDISQIPMDMVGKMKYFIEATKQPMLTWKMADGTVLQVQRTDFEDIVRYWGVKKVVDWMLCFATSPSNSSLASKLTFFDFGFLQGGAVVQLFPQLSLDVQQALLRTCSQSMYSMLGDNNKPLSLITMNSYPNTTTALKYKKALEDYFKQHNKPFHCEWYGTLNYTPCFSPIWQYWTPSINFTRLNKGGNVVIRASSGTGWLQVDGNGNSTPYTPTPSGITLPESVEFVTADGLGHPFIHNFAVNGIVDPSKYYYPSWGSNFPNSISATLNTISHDTRGHASCIPYDLSANFYGVGAGLLAEWSGNLLGYVPRYNPVSETNPDSCVLYYMGDGMNLLARIDYTVNPNVDNAVAYKLPWKKDETPNYYPVNGPIVMVNWQDNNFRIDALVFSDFPSIYTARLTQKIYVNQIDVTKSFKTLLNLADETIFSDTKKQVIQGIILIPKP